MGGRGGLGHYPGTYGRTPDFSGFYVPRTLREAIDTHLRLESFTDAMWNAIPAEERDAIRAYTGNAYVPINDALFGKNAASSGTQRLIDLATQGMDRFEAKFDFVAVRGDKPGDMASLLQGTVAQLSKRRNVRRHCVTSWIGRRRPMNITAIPLERRTPRPLRRNRIWKPRVRNISSPARKCRSCPVNATRCAKAPRMPRTRYRPHRHS